MEDSQFPSSSGSQGRIRNARTKHLGKPRLNLQEQALEKIAALYWDVNCVCNFQQIVNDAPFKDDYTEYQRMKHNTELFINQAVTDYISALNTGTTTRCVSFISQTSWKIFAICAHSEAFQLASVHAGSSGWFTLVDLIKQNSRSLEVFARSRELEWRGCLLTYCQYNIPGLQEELSPELNIAQEHPHHTVLLADGHLKRPIFQGQAQVHIGTSIWEPEFYPNHPTASPDQRTKLMGACFLCRSRKICQCSFQSMAGDLVELFESPNMGTGIRSLGSFNRGDYLGEYAGIVAPVNVQSTEAVYALSISAPNNITGKMDTKANVFPHQYGNWTRYINHSCEPAVSYVCTVVGDKVTTGLRANRKISMFEVLTVDYGNDYWRTRDYYCLCGTPSCMKPDPNRMCE
ncbi:hypothetical protein N7493_010449 [Penicillium malachiteum]|uniref:SET domain-containing protein n=1 Tax=Penicillium malachiteum TaxID=1324776 RepID=A0AAD6MRI3_9EURO|nr:hypothetical protein N7493_010449 [Penicillium malachiteum]